MPTTLIWLPCYNNWPLYSDPNKSSVTIFLYLNNHFNTTTLLKAYWWTNWTGLDTL